MRGVGAMFAVIALVLMGVGLSAHAMRLDYLGTTALIAAAVLSIHALQLSAQ